MENKAPSSTMEDDGDDKDDTKRRTRNLSEKKRRDQFNMLVTELSSLITTNNRKMDKSTVLKSTISFLKNHNEVSVRSRAHDVQDDWKPAFLSNEEFTYLVLEALEGFVMVFSVSGRIYYVSESITTLLGHNPEDVVNKSIFDLAFEEDRPNLYNLLQSSAMATEQMPNSSKESGMIKFQIHLQRGTLYFREDVSYDLIQFYGHFQSNQDQGDEERDRMGYQQDHDSRMIFICICRLYTPQLIRDVSLVDSSRNEFTSRHSLEWKFLFLDHRAPPIIGYLPFEVLGTSGYDYYHFDDLEKVVNCHEALMQKGELTSCYYRFLTKGQQWIWLQTRFYITYHQWNSKPEFVVCTHRVVSYADLLKTTKEEVPDVDVSEAEASQNIMKDTPTEDPMPSLSPSYMSEDASDTYANSYQAISQSTLMVPSSREYLQPVSETFFTNHSASRAKRLSLPSNASPTFELTSKSSPSSNDQLTCSQSDCMSRSGPVPSTCSSSASSQRHEFTPSKSQLNTAKHAVPQLNNAIQAPSQPDSLLKAISHSETLIEEISKSNAAIQAMSQSLSATEAVSQSNVALHAISQSNAVIHAISRSNAAIHELSQSNAEIQKIAQSNATLKFISQSNAAVRIISQSNETIQAMSQSNAELHAITQSNIATQAMSPANAEVQLYSCEEKQSMYLANCKNPDEQYDAERYQSDAEVQVILHASGGTQSFPVIPMVTITKPGETTPASVPLPSISPSYTAETATDDFGNTFQLVSQNNILTTPSPEPQCLSPSYLSDRSDSYNNSYQSFSQRAGGSVSERVFPASSPTSLSEAASDSFVNYCNQRWKSASVKSATAGSTAGTVNTAATTSATWKRKQACYTASSEAGSLSEESRSSQRNSERETHKPMETMVAPQHGIGAQYLEPAAYGAGVGAPSGAVSAGVLSVATVPVIVTADHAQIQEQLQRKHEELQEMIMRQQEELRQVKEQLLLARLGILQPLINVPNPYSTPEEMQNQQRMSQLAYTNVGPRAIVYPQHVPLPMPSLPGLPTQPALPSLAPHPLNSQLPMHPQHTPHSQHTPHPSQPPHSTHPSEPHQHMSQ